MFKKKEKTYTFDKFGYAQAILDARLEKQEKINNIASLVILLGFLGFKLLSKEYLLLYLSSKVISILSDLLIE